MREMHKTKYLGCDSQVPTVEEIETRIAFFRRRSDEGNVNNKSHTAEKVADEEKGGESKTTPGVEQVAKEDKDEDDGNDDEEPPPLPVIGDKEVAVASTVALPL